MKPHGNGAGKHALNAATQMGPWSRSRSTTGFSFCGISLRKRTTFPGCYIWYRWRRWYVPHHFQVSNFSFFFWGGCYTYSIPQGGPMCWLSWPCFIPGWFSMVFLVVPGATKATKSQVCQVVFMASEAISYHAIWWNVDVPRRAVSISHFHWLHPVFV